MTPRTAPPDLLVRFEELYLEHYRSIYGYVRRRVHGDAPICDDLVADIFAVAWRRLAEVPVAPQDRLWLFGVARRRVLENHRSQASRGRLLSRLASQREPEVQAPTLSNPLHLQLHRALNELPPLDREVLLLVVWDGLTHLDAASVLNCSVNAVALRIRRAKGRLRGALAGSPGLPSDKSPSVAISLKETP